MKKYIIKILLICFIILSLLYLTNCSKKYTITFDEQGGTNVEDVILKKDKDIILPTPKKEGYTFLGWYLNDVLYEETTMPNENITLVAKWEEIIVEPTLYTITFDEQGGNEVENIISSPNSTIELSIPTKEGYNFLGWYLNDVLYEETIMPSENITLVAKWETITCNITFDENGGSDVDDITNLYGTTIILPTPERKYYNFLGWYLNDDLYEETTMYEENITLVAKWEKKGPINPYGTYEYFCQLDGIDYEYLEELNTYSFEDRYTMMAEFTILSDKESCVRDTAKIYDYYDRHRLNIDSYLVDIKINKLFLSDVYRKEENIIYRANGLYYKSLDTLLEDLDIQLQYAIPADLFDEVMKYETIIAKVNLFFVYHPLKNIKLEDGEINGDIENLQCIGIPVNSILYAEPGDYNSLEFLENYIFGVENGYIKTVTEKTITSYYFKKYIKYIYFNISDNPTYEEFVHYIYEVMDRYYWRYLMMIDWFYNKVEIDTDVTPLRF